MDFITGLFDMDFAALVPEMEALLGFVRVILSLLMLAGPLSMLVLGVLYLFAAPPEANYKFGFRTYFGMGSMEAWKFSQRIAGIAYAGLGLILLIIMLIVTISFGGKDSFQITSAAITALLWQVGLALAARLTVGILAAVYFTADGSRRRQ